jgi:peptidoglycan/LPS O-acetylase OafA/YrhL
MLQTIYKKIKQFTPIIAAIASFGCIFLFLLKSLPGIETVEIDMEIDHVDFLKVYFSDSRSFREGASSQSVPINPQRSKVKVALGNSYDNLLRIDPGDEKGIAKIYQIKISSYFIAPLVLGPNEIADLFTVKTGNTQMILSGDHIEVISTGNDPYIVSKNRLLPPMYLVSSAIAVLFSLLIFIISSPGRLQVKTIPAQEVKPAMAIDRYERLDALDGLRGLATMMVIADHTCGWFRGLGATGVWIFFALSGFLLARPFIHNADFVLSFDYMSGYFRRRFMRIFPMYYTYIFVVYIISGRFNLGFLHALFLEGDGHLWAIPQEMLFYLLFPLVVLTVYLPLKNYPRIVPFLLLLLLTAWNHFIGIEKIWLLGMDHIRLRLFFGIFLVGAFFSSIYSIYWPSIDNNSLFKKVSTRLASPVGIGILIFFILFSTGHIFNRKNIYSQEYFGFYGFLAGFLIFCILAARGKILDRILTLAPLRALGIVGLSLYLVHPLIKNILQGASVFFFNFKLINFPLFLATLACSYLLAAYTYSHIEQPGFLQKSTDNLK